MFSCCRSVVAANLATATCSRSIPSFHPACCKTSAIVAKCCSIHCQASRSCGIFEFPGRVHLSSSSRKSVSASNSLSSFEQTDRHFSNESGSLESQYEELLKSALRLRRSNAHSARTALCGAVLALSGTGAMVSVIPRPVPWHQRLDNRRSPLGASQPKKQQKNPSLASTISRFC